MVWVHAGSPQGWRKARLEDDTLWLDFPKRSSVILLRKVVDGTTGTSVQIEDSRSGVLFVERPFLTTLGSAPRAAEEERLVSKIMNGLIDPADGRPWAIEAAVAWGIVGLLLAYQNAARDARAKTIQLTKHQPPLKDDQARWISAVLQAVAQSGMFSQDPDLGAVALEAGTLVCIHGLGSQLLNGMHGSCKRPLDHDRRCWEVRLIDGRDVRVLRNNLVPLRLMKLIRLFVTHPIPNQVTGRTGLFELGSLINHSCEPNLAQPVVWSQVKSIGKFEGKIYPDMLAWNSLDALSPGTQLTFNYQSSTSSLPLEERRSQLCQIFFFQCGCSRCRREGAKLEPSPPASRSIQDVASSCSSTSIPGNNIVGNVDTKKEDADAALAGTSACGTHMDLDSLD